MSNRFKRTCCGLLFGILALIGHVYAQTTNLSGVINTYAQVTGVNVATNAVTANPVTGFAIGDTVLIIQMQGATIDETNSAAFGNVTSMGNAGNYELAVICDIDGNDVVFDAQLSRTYSSSSTAGVQLVSYPNYGNVLINGTINALPWNGSTGGVVAFKSSGTVTFAANINLSQAGFAGGSPSVNGGACGSFGNFFLASGSLDGGYKGEGIADIILAKEQGKGKQATGGGGGNGHNCGGGGGSNFGAGGNGGNKSSGCSILNSNNPGIGGVSMSAQYAANRVFLGSGGGGGQQNNAGGTAGGRGGGLALIEAATINGSGFSILATGGTPPNISINEDGGGGGGAGGTVLLKAASFSSPITVDVRGGNGGNTFTVGTRNLGPGGGGGGGLLWLSTGSLDPNITLQNAAGTAGISQACACVHGATNGAAGGFMTGLSLPMSLTDFTGCNLELLPISFASILADRVDDAVQVSWSAYSSTGIDYFEVERSQDGLAFGPIGRINADAHGAGDYSLMDLSPAIGNNFYRIRAVGLAGDYSISETRMVAFALDKVTLISIFPNPVTAQQALNIEIASPTDAIAALEVFDMLGKVKWAGTIDLKAGQNTTHIRVPELPTGIYFLRVNADKHGEFVKMVKVH